MKKYFAIIPIAILIILLSVDTPAKADSSHYMITYATTTDQYGELYTCKLWNAKATSSIVQSSDGSYSITNMYTNTSGEYNSSSRVSMAEAMAEIYSEASQLPSDFTGRNYTINANSNIILNNVSYTVNNPTNGDFFPSIDDYEQSVNPQTSWWNSMWDTLGDALGDPNFWFGEWFVNIIDNIFSNDEGGGPSEHSISTHVQIENPTLTPAPTSIPYTTVVIPKTDPVSGDTYYETNYYYNNPSGTPIVQPYPPTNTPATNSPSNGTDYIPVGGDPYSIPFVNWLTSTSIGDSEYDCIDSVGSGLDSIDTIGSEYNDGMGAVQDATGTLPTSWLLLIGIAAAIPLIAGIISRFLS